MIPTPLVQNSDLIDTLHEEIGPLLTKLKRFNLCLQYKCYPQDPDHKGWTIFLSGTVEKTHLSAGGYHTWCLSSQLPSSPFKPV